MLIKRKIEKELNEWLSSKYALIVYGARQVGKTYTIRNFLDQNYPGYLYINLHQNVSLIKNLISSIDTDDFLLRLSLFDKDHNFKEDTCIFIDEIQEYYTYLQKHPEIEDYFDIISQSKYIVSESKHRFVLSGSLLRLEMNNLITNPVGYLLPIEMYPLDFEEFIYANGINGNIIDVVRKCFNNKETVPEPIHNSLLYLFKKYLLVGGMPQAVSEFLDTNSFSAVSKTHDAIEYYIKEDITKYAEDNEKLKIKEIYNLIPTELSSLSRRFILFDIEGHTKNDDDQLSFTWLNNAGITIPVYSCTNPKIPLIITSSRNKFKLFHEDVGILTYLLFDDNEKTKILNGETDINFGPIYENAVAQNLYAHGFSDLYYYNSKKNGEVDFLIENRSEVIPIEVKSGKNYSTHRALNNIMDIEEYDLQRAFVLGNENVKRVDKLIYLPIYMVMFFVHKANF